jgi:hypothetical protein
MKISDELFFNIVKDWEKKDVSTEEKGRLIKIYLKEKKISQRINKEYIPFLLSNSC